MFHRTEKPLRFIRAKNNNSSKNSSKIKAELDFDLRLIIAKNRKRTERQRESAEKKTRFGPVCWVYAIKTTTISICVYIFWSGRTHFVSSLQMRAEFVVEARVNQFIAFSKNNGNFKWKRIEKSSISRQIQARCDFSLWISPSGQCC